MIVWETSLSFASNRLWMASSMSPMPKPTLSTAPPCAQISSAWVSIKGLSHSIMTASPAEDPKSSERGIPHQLMKFTVFMACVDITDEPAMTLNGCV